MKKTVVIERKGLGHPDTLADNIAERLAQLLKTEYQKVFGKHMHYNADKVLLSCGKVDYEKKVMVKPVKIVFSGNATPLNNMNLLLETVIREVLKREISRGLTYEIFNHIAECSPDLTSNFDANKCNDTSFAVGFPLEIEESLVLELGKFLEELSDVKDWVGTDYKIMYINGEIFLANAFIASDREAYDEYKNMLKALIKDKFGLDVKINTGDNETNCFNTVTGTSLEQGDAGMVGRGNRLNGLITPLKPMTMEAYFGKNDVTHNGRIYQDIAQVIAEREGCAVLLVNNIGNSIDDYKIYRMDEK